MATPSTIAYATAPSAIASSTPVTVTVRGTFQLAAVKVRLETLTMPSVTSFEATAMVTSAAGWLLRTTVKLAVPPASVVSRPATGVTVTPEASLSVFVTATSVGSAPA